jgi:glycerophosphoryl diester phosphodiesterase
VIEMPKRWRALLLIILLFGTLVYLNNTNLMAARREGKPTLLAHRGIAQQFDMTDVANDTCTASRMRPPSHHYLENTIGSIQASFAAGADIVEFDVHPTLDGQFAVFHDWTLDCRTNGHGITREHTMAELKQLDIGYGYTADGGKSFPFRGKAVGQMPSLQEVFELFPGRSFLINVKSNDPAEGAQLAAVLSQLSTVRRRELMVYGGDKPVETLARLLPDVRTMSRASLKACLIPYIAYGWTGLVPASCRHMLVFVPINVAPWLWGWPDRLLARMKSVDSAIFVVGPYRGGEFSTGVDTHADVARLPAGYAGGVLTNDVEMLSRALERAMR